jgi:uncharacterized protein involved in response to NO
VNPGPPGAPKTPREQRAESGAPQAAPIPALARWHFRWLLAAPHRLAFFGAGVMFSASALWWIGVLWSRLDGWPVLWRVSPVLAHSLLMTFGFTPLFFCGFLFTAGPKWLAQPEQQASALLPTVGAALAGWTLFVLGVNRSATLAAIGLAVVAAGWGVFTLRLWRLVRTSRVRDRTHPRWVGAACTIGAFAMWAAAAGLAAQREDIARAAVQLGLWGFVALVFSTVAHRMIPFFGDGGLARLDLRWPAWLLWVFGATLGLQASSASSTRSPGRRGLARTRCAPRSGAIRAAARRSRAALVAIPKLRIPLRQRLPRMMYIGFAWLAVALAMAAVSDALAAFSGGSVTLGLAPLHAMTMGFLASVLLAMASRVACGHSGRSLVADALLWSVFWLLQAAVLARLASALWPALPPFVLMFAALAWAGVATAWALRYGRWFGLPRSDGHPG